MTPEQLKEKRRHLHWKLDRLNTEIRCLEDERADIEVELDDLDEDELARDDEEQP